MAGIIVARAAEAEERGWECNICLTARATTVVEIGNRSNYALRFCDADFERLTNAVDVRYWERYEEGTRGTV